MCCVLSGQGPPNREWFLFRLVKDRRQQCRDMTMPEWGRVGKRFVPACADLAIFEADFLLPEVDIKKEFSSPLGRNIPLLWDVLQHQVQA